MVTVPQSIAVTGIAAASSITTEFNYILSSLGNMFDGTVVSASDVVIHSFDVHVDSEYSTVPVTVYNKSGRYVGSETNSGAWTLVGTANVSVQGLNQPTPLLIGGIHLASGQTYGFFFTMDDPNTNLSMMMYSTGSKTYQDANFKNGLWKRSVIVGIFGYKLPIYLERNYLLSYCCRNNIAINRRSLQALPVAVLRNYRTIRRFVFNPYCQTISEAHSEIDAIPQKLNYIFS